MKKNDLYTVDIIDSGMNFEGMAKIGGITVFVPNAIIGENVDIKLIKITSKYMIGKIEKINKKSKYRIEDVVCPVFNSCGGCDLQHIDYNFQLKLKTLMVKNTFKKQNINEYILNNAIGMMRPYYYRNKVQYPVRNINGENKIGFYSKRSHNIIENKECYIQDKRVDDLAKKVFNKLMSSGFNGYNEESNSGDIKHIVVKKGYHTDEIMIIIVVNNEKLLNDNRFNEITIDFNKENVKSIFLNLNNKNTNKILGEKNICIFGEEYITDNIEEFTYYISPNSFFQVNTLQTGILYNTLKQELKLNKNDVLLDLYSGVGSIGIFLSKEVQKVYGIEIEEEAVKMANLNITRNNIINSEYISGSVEDKIKEFEIRKIKPTVIVVDPPRKGLDEISINHILKLNPQKIGYVSCNPVTLVRDLKLLKEKYDIQSVTPVDMFPQTNHVETITILIRKE